VGTQTGDIIVRAMVPGVDTIDRAITVQYVGGNINNVKTILPVDGSQTDALPKFQWEKKADATNYRIELSKDASFSTLLANAVLSDSNYVSPVILEPGKVYFWRVTGLNDCGDGSKGGTRAFITKAFNCITGTSGVQSVVLSGAGTPSAELNAEITADGSASDVNVKLIKADHSRNSDLVVSLISPSGKSVLLWSKKCGTSQNVNVGVDDQSPSFFGCPINTGKVYRPEGKLSDFNGESTKGTWKLKVDDVLSGSGGKLLEFNLEICASLTPKNPYLTKNETLKLYPNERANIGNQLLAAADDDNTADQLTFTIVEIPSRGTLLFNGQPIVAGSSFSQVDINNGKLEYKSTSASNTTDNFRFIVTDGVGGWINITNFNIDVNTANPSPTKDVELLASLSIYPNPTSDQIYIVRGDNILDFNKYEVRDITGRVVLTGLLTSTHQTISVGNINSGVYSLNLLSGDNQIAKKLIKI
jgi:subtilisin-like proprotein convertase family protein